MLQVRFQLIESSLTIAKSVLVYYIAYNGNSPIKSFLFIQNVCGCSLYSIAHLRSLSHITSPNHVIFNIRRKVSAYNQPIIVPGLSLTSVYKFNLVTSSVAFTRCSHVQRIGEYKPEAAAATSHICISSRSRGMSSRLYISDK